MKQMTLIEMDGFLKGKCIPRDLKVNETNAEYLVRKFAEAEAKCAALAAENAGMKHAMAVTLEHVSVTDAGQAGVAAMIINDALHHSETPATDAFLAEVWAQGVEMFADNLLCPDLDDTIRDFAAQLRKGGNQ
ncbi:hypothetical protein ACY61_19810 [Salmonella enterica subsp. enterica serovar Saintpaul]|uniref:Ead/Ea22-like family protein n=5 Tax=Salmonella enterica TaxID=28901 RepID=A0A5V0A8Z0_SALET|nr:MULTISPECIES: hypothetical protein [Salmonella]EAB9292980.1 hypothetical protein [Salmonella enterica subsp. enterica serovar Stanley]EBB7589052.1 hypothetical protein [Salmonella enterica subsp. enterica serovar Kentucky]EBE4660250.1 hypothetical protein [Salmonella enterica subsp. enterica serovar Heidelberg]EBH8071726.1 hypothetical protein [Salmonella bongori]EBH8228098.1 hypothetical protein [Salmonella enterica subsp. enterica serovar Typhimurium str. UK-1]EBH8313574.1 hypothetical p